MYLQSTIRKRIQVEGLGLHKGEPASLTFCPAPEGTGVHFVRRDLEGEPWISPEAQFVQATKLATTLGSDYFSVSTVEHCLSAVAALRIDNLIIELNGPEIPICDGSAKEFYDALMKVGIVEQEQPRQYCRIVKPVYFGDGEKHAYIVPYNGLRITCEIDFDHSEIGQQKIDIDINPHSFGKEIANARTFGFVKDVEQLHAAGLALGGSYQNAIILGEDVVLNEEGLRWPDEFVRHKALDAVGDISTLGMPLLGHIILYKAGHDLMNKLIQKLLSSPESYKKMELAGGLGDRAAHQKELWGI
ncbi:MAG: UDP-3-O-acyl-N-acetylglucosamine deacetylase [Bdellovibrionales bacterium]